MNFQNPNERVNLALKVIRTELSRAGMSDSFHSIKDVGYAHDPRLGVTFVKLQTDKGNEFIGFARRSDSDKQNEQVGLETATARAVKDLIAFNFSETLTLYNEAPLAAAPFEEDLEDLAFQKGIARALLTDVEDVLRSMGIAV